MQNWVLHTGAEYSQSIAKQYIHSL